MKKENDSDIREALRSIIDESAPLTPDWQQAVLAGIDAKKPRRLMIRLPRIAAAAAVIAIVITAAWFHTPSPEPLRQVNPRGTANPVLAEAKTTPEPVRAPEPTVRQGVHDSQTANDRCPVDAKPADEGEQSEPIIIFDTDLYSIDPENPEVNNSIPPDEWIESLIASELTHQYLTTISTMVSEEEPTNTSDI